MIFYYANQIENNITKQATKKYLNSIMYLNDFILEELKLFLELI